MYGKDDQYHSYDPGGSSVKEMMARLMQLQGKITSTISEVTRIDGDVSSVSEKQSQISQDVDSIELEVYSVDSNGVKTSRISQNAENINLRVEKDKAISQINLSPETIKFDAKFIQIDGTTTFASGYDPTTKETPSGAQAKVDTLKNSLGSLAYDSLVEKAKLGTTVINGGYLVTELIEAKSIGADKIAANVITANHIDSLNGLNVGNGQFVVDEVGNVTIGGELNGATGTFSGELSTAEKLRVKNPQLSGIGGVSLELETGFLSADGSTYTPNGYVYLDTFNEKLNIGQINSDGLFQQLKRLNFDSEFTEFDGDVNIRGATTADKITLDSIYGKYLDSYILQDHNNGNVTVNALGATLYLGYINTTNIRAMNDIYMEPGKRIIARGSETGYMGIGTYLASANTGVIVGTGVNFRAEKNYTPASISISQSSGVLSNSAGLKIADINTHGFWLYIENQTAGLRYWRGTYTA